jgi:hypothetical protein
MTVSVFTNVFDAAELQCLIEFYDSMPIINSRHDEHDRVIRHMKNSQYNLEDTDPYKILHPKLQAILGQHEFSGGHYMDSHLPFKLHVDSISAYEHNGVKIFDAPAQQNKGVLIPLIQGPHFHTIFFEHYLDRFVFDDLENMLCNTVPPSQDPDWFGLMDHHSPDWFNCIRRLTIDRVVNWQLGDVICWPRNQVHCSSNFSKHGLTKQAIVLWI